MSLASRWISFGRVGCVATHGPRRVAGVAAAFAFRRIQLPDPTEESGRRTVCSPPYKVLFSKLSKQRPLLECSLKSELEESQSLEGRYLRIFNSVTGSAACGSVRQALMNWFALASATSSDCPAPRNC